MTHPSPTVTRCLACVREWHNPADYPDDIHAFLAADAAWIEKSMTYGGHWRKAKAAAEAAFDALLPEYLRGKGLHLDHDIEDRYVWMPLLTAQYDGDEEAAQVAWALGERPAEHPETVIRSRPSYRGQ